MRYCFLGCLSLLLLGCATVGTLEPGAGSSFEVQGRSYDEVWKAAVTVVTQTLTIMESDKARGSIKAEKGAGLTSWGEVVVGVFISPAGQDSDHYTVEVVSQKRMKTQVTGQNWEKTIIEGMKAELNI